MIIVSFLQFLAQSDCFRIKKHPENAGLGESQFSQNPFMSGFLIFCDDPPHINLKDGVELSFRTFSFLWGSFNTAGLKRPAVPCF